MRPDVLAKTRESTGQRNVIRSLVDSLLPFAINFISNFCSLYFLKKIDSGTGEFVAAFSVAFVASALADQATLARGYKTVRQGAGKNKLHLVIYPRMAIILAALPVAATIYFYSFKVPFNAVSLIYSCLFVITNSTWLYLCGLHRCFYLVSLLRFVAACSIYFLQGYGDGFVACAILLLALGLIREVIGPFSKLKLRHIKVTLLRALIYSGCRLPGLFFLSAVALCDTAFGLKSASGAAYAVYVDGMYKLLSGLAGPLGIVIAKINRLRELLRSSASRVFLVGIAFLGLWLHASTWADERLFFVFSCVVLSGCFLLSFSYGITLCRNFSDERWLCVIGFAAAIGGLALSVVVRWAGLTALAGPIAALVFLEATSFLLRTAFRSRV